MATAGTKKMEATEMSQPIAVAHSGYVYFVLSERYSSGGAQTTPQMIMNFSIVLV